MKVKKIKKQRVKMEKENKITVMGTFDEIKERNGAS